MISTFTAIFDANVLFGARLRSLLMELAMSGLFRARWTEHIHPEWMQAVSEKRGLRIDVLMPTRRAMDAAVPDALVTGYEELVTGLTLPDENDRHVLAAAIRCNASVIVTFNEKDFPAAVLDKYGIHTRHPDEFIRNIDEIDPGTLVDAVKSDLEHYQNPPLTFDRYIEGLRLAGVPQTADYLNKLRVLFVTQ